MPIASVEKFRLEICEIGRRMYDRGFVAANDGNLSVRLENNEVLTTPTGVSKGFMSPDSLVIVGMDGKPSGPGAPSSEIKMHLLIYRERPEVNSVVHAHPICATGFATAGLSLESCVAAEIIVTLGSIPLAAYGTPTTTELAETLRAHIHHSDGILLSNHGVVTVGKDVLEAYHKMERIEHYANIVWIARQLGGERELPRHEVDKLFALRERYGQSGLNPGCATCHDECIGSSCVNYAAKYDAAGRDGLAEIVDRIIARLRVPE